MNKARSSKRRREEPPPASCATRARAGPVRDRQPISSQPTRPLLLPLVIVALLLGSGLVAWRTLGSAPSSVTKTGTGEAAPPIVAATVDGARFSLAAQRGRVVVLYAMAVWCKPVPETTALGQLAQADGRSGVATLLVDESPQTDTPQALRDFRDGVQGKALSWAIIDRGGLLAQAYRIAALDTTVVIDRSGHIAARYSGSIDLATLQSAVRPLL